jgi:plastocyanin
VSGRHHRARLALTAVVLAALVLAGCSSPPSETSPSVAFGSDSGVTPGMPGMSGVPSKPGAPAATTASATGSTVPEAGDAVSIDNFAFVPPTLTVAAGSTVTWTNLDEEPHTVVADDGSFHSPGMGLQGTYSYTFPTPGRFEYVCSVHPFMRATVVVTR